jgi:hypothetical protein
MLLAITLTFALLSQQGAVPTAPPPAQSAPAKPPCRNPKADGKYRIGCGVTQPQLIKKVDPSLPEGAARMPKSAIVSLIVNTEGMPTNIRIVRSSADGVKDPALAAQIDKAFIEAVNGYRFKPAMFQGKPVAVVLNIELNVD